VQPWAIGCRRTPLSTGTARAQPRDRYGMAQGRQRSAWSCRHPPASRSIGGRPASDRHDTPRSLVPGLPSTIRHCTTFCTSSRRPEDGPHAPPTRRPPYAHAGASAPGRASFAAGWLARIPWDSSRPQLAVHPHRAVGRAGRPVPAVASLTVGCSRCEIFRVDRNHQGRLRRRLRRSSPLDGTRPRVPELAAIGSREGPGASPRSRGLRCSPFAVTVRLGIQPLDGCAGTTKGASYLLRDGLSLR
jgi:hypothetical protein